MNIDCKIYISNIVSFFNKNPKDLALLIPVEKKEEFYSKIAIVAERNVEKGDEPTLTKKQMIDICLELNHPPIQEIKKTPIITTEWGIYSLN